MKTLHVRIYEQYLSAIIKGAKTTEYREMSDYWMRKLVETDRYGSSSQNTDDLRQAIQTDAKPPFVPYTHITFHSGKNTATYQIMSIRVYPHHDYFAIKLGKRTDRVNTATK